MSIFSRSVAAAHLICFLTHFPLATTADAQVTAALEKQLLRELCNSPAAREKYVSNEIAHGNAEYARAAAKWDLDISCERIDLPEAPIHDTAHPAPEATHHHWIYDAQWSPDGKTIVTAGRDKTVRIWDTATGQQIKRIDLTKYANRVSYDDAAMARFARFIDNGRAIVVAADAHPVRIFDVAVGEPVAEIPYRFADPNEKNPPFVATTNALVVLGGYGSDVVVYDVKAKAVRFTLSGVKGEYPQFSVSDKAGLLAVAQPVRNGETRLQLLKLQSGQPIWEIVLKGSLKGDVALSRDGTKLALGLNRQLRRDDPADRRIHVLSTADKRVLASIAAHPYWTSNRLAFTADGKGLIAGITHPMLWSLDTGKRLHHFGVFEDNWHSADISPDGRFLVTGHLGSDARIWEIATGKFYRRLGRNIPRKP